MALTAHKPLEITLINKYMKPTILSIALFCLAFASCSRQGCTDPQATNFNDKHSSDDGSCVYILGCTDTDAYNFDSTATKDDGSCKYMGDVMFWTATEGRQIVAVHEGEYYGPSNGHYNLSNGELPITCGEERALTLRLREDVTTVKITVFGAGPSRTFFWPVEPRKDRCQLIYII